MRVYALALVALSLGTSARAEELGCTLTVEPRAARVGDQITVALEVRGETDADPKALLSGALPTSLAVASTSSTMSMQIVGGERSITRTARLVAVAGTAGKLTIGPVQIGGASCEAVALRVGPAPKGGAGKAAAPRQGGAAPGAPVGDIHPSVEPSELRVGKEAVLRYDLSGVGSQVRRVVEGPAIEGAFVQWAEKPDDDALRLVPLWPGKVTVGPVSMDVGSDIFWSDRRSVVATRAAALDVAPRAGTGRALADLKAGTPATRGAGVAVLLLRPGDVREVRLAVKLARALTEAGMEVAVVRGTAPSFVIVDPTAQADVVEAALLDAEAREKANGVWGRSLPPASSTAVLVGAAQALTRPGPRVIVTLAPLQCSGTQLGCASLARALKELGVHLLRPGSADDATPGTAVQLGPDPADVAALVARVRRLEAVDPLWKELAGTWVPDMLRLVWDTAQTSRFKALTSTAPTQDL